MNIASLQSKMNNKDSEVNQIVKNEITIMKLMNHKNIVKLVEALEDDASEKVYLIMEFCSKGAIMSEPFWKAEDQHHGSPSKPGKMFLSESILNAMNRCLEYGQAKLYIQQAAEGIYYSSQRLTQCTWWQVSTTTTSSQRTSLSRVQTS